MYSYITFIRGKKTIVTFIMIYILTVLFIGESLEKTRFWQHYDTIKPHNHLPLLQLQRFCYRIGYINKLVWFSSFSIGLFQLSIEGFNIRIPCVGGGAEASRGKKLTQSMPQRHFESSICRLRCLCFPTRIPLHPSSSSCCGGRLAWRIDQSWSRSPDYH